MGDGRGLTVLGSGVGQRRSPLWSNMAYLTGLGSGRVQSTAGAALTMTALWQVYLRWSCLMYARPLFFLPLFSPLSPPCPPSPPLYSCHHFPRSVCFHLPITLPSRSCALCSLSLLLASSFSASPRAYLCQWLPLQSITSCPFARMSLHLTSLHLISLIISKMLSLASSHSSPSSNSLLAPQLGSPSLLSPFPSLFSHLYPCFPLHKLYFIPPLKQFITLLCTPHFKHNIFTSFIMPREQ